MKLKSFCQKEKIRKPSLCTLVRWMCCRGSFSVRLSWNIQFPAGGNSAHAACRLLLASHNVVYHICRRFSKSFFLPLYLHHVASQRKSLLLFPLYGFIFLLLQVGLLFIVCFCCYLFVHWHIRQRLQLHTQCSHQQLEYVATLSVNVELERKIHRWAWCHSLLCTYHSTVYFSKSRTSRIA